MPESQPVSAEVRAAQRALSRKGISDPTPAPADSTVAGLARITPTVDQLLAEILSADHVDIVGVLPWSCTSRLIELSRIGGGSSGEVIHPKRVRYFTPSGDRITLYRHSGVLGTVVRRWAAGIVGVRNWLLPQASASSSEEVLSVYEFDEIYLDCLICIQKDGDYTVTAISQLPAVEVSSTRSRGEEALLIITRMSSEQVEDFKAYLDSLIRRSTAVRPWQVHCSYEGEPETISYGDEFRPVVSHLNAYGAPWPPGVVVPVAVVAPCVATARGPAILLKHRTERNARDDFGTLSLISERVVVDDWAELLTLPVSLDPTQALEDLWLRAGQPESFTLPDTAFLSAAQRELFLSCGLDIVSDRLRLCGSCLLDRENEGTHLGFYVYRLDLQRRPKDELDHARQWNPDLQVVLLRDLYSPLYRGRLNRLLRRRENWLRENVLSNKPASR